MISVLLQAWVSNSKGKNSFPKSDMLYLIFLIILTAFNIIPLLFYSSKFTITNPFVIVSIGSFIGMLVVVSIWDKNNIKRYSNHYENLNIRLDILKNILKNFRYGCFKNWYSKAKINHLICSFESYIKEKENRNTKLINLGKTLILPIIGFVAGVIAERSSIEFTLSVGIAAFLFIICVYSLQLLFEAIENIIFKSLSIYEMKYLLSLLKDLLARDFDVELHN